MSTGDAAQDFLIRQKFQALPFPPDTRSRGQRCWDTLLAVFRQRQPDEAQLALVSVISEVAIDQVFSAYHLDDEQCRRLHGSVKDYAECASLYGFVMGYHHALLDCARKDTIPTVD